MHYATCEEQCCVCSLPWMFSHSCCSLWKRLRSKVSPKSLYCRGYTEGYSHTYFLLVEGETRGEVDLSEINLLSGVTQAGYAPIFWIPFILNETVTFALVVHKARKSGRFPGVGRAASTILFDTLIQHSIFYYLTYIIFAALVQLKHGNLLVLLVSSLSTRLDYCLSSIS